MNFRNKKAVLFDMDGLLLDTEIIAYEVFKASAAEKGFDATLSTYVKCIGANKYKVKSILCDGYGKDFPYDEIYEEWKKRYHHKLVEEVIPVKKGSFELMQYLKENGFKLAVCTSTFRELAKLKLEKTNLLTLLDTFVCGDDVKESKPHPEIYLEASNLLGISAEECIVLEDSENGVLAGLSAQMLTIQIPDLKMPDDEFLLNGHMVQKSLLDVLELLKK